MKYIKYAIYTFTLAMLSGCEKNNRSIINTTQKILIEDFPQAQFLSGEIMKNISDSLFKPTNLFINGNHLFVTETTSNNLLHIINLQNNTYLGKRGKRGPRPGEVLNIWHFSSNSNGKIALFDIELGKILIYNIDSLIQNKSAEQEYTNKNLIYSKSIGMHENDLFYLENVFNKAKSSVRFYITKINDPTQSSESIGNLPVLTSHYPNFPKEQEQLVLANARLVNNKNIVAIPSNNIPLLEIYNLDTKEKQTISGPDELPSEDRFGKIYYHSYPYITEKFIYILYINDRLNPDYNTSTILVFDHTGNPVKKIELDQKAFSLAVLNDEYIYTLSENINTFEYTISKYDLKTNSNR